MTRRFLAVLPLAVAFAPLCASGQDLGPDAEALRKSRERAVEFLQTTQADDGTWTSPGATGITALVTYGLLSAGARADDPVVAKALARIESLGQPDGRVCEASSRIPAYETAIALMALQAGNTSGRYEAVIDKAETYLRSVQVGGKGDVDQSNLSFGGAGYAPGGGRADLSNTSFFLEALQAAGVKADDPAVRNALVFISRCQNLESEFNTTPNAAKVNDGGFYYTVAAGGNSPAGREPEGGLRSYGSMTYAGFKSLLYAGVGADDPRVKAALEWIQKNFTVSENPGMGSNGLFYYYYLFAKALNASGIDRLEDESGQPHDWRKELAEHLFQIQQPNGSWVNSASDRWMEGDPNLVTAYVLVALKACEHAP